MGGYKLKELFGSVKKTPRNPILWVELAIESRDRWRLKKSGQQTPRRWGWGTPLKKRAATRMA
jgi:hypothetical protein